MQRLIFAHCELVHICFFAQRLPVPVQSSRKHRIANHLETKVKTTTALVAPVANGATAKTVKTTHQDFVRYGKTVLKDPDVNVGAELPQVWLLEQSLRQLSPQSSLRGPGHPPRRSLRSEIGSVLRGAHNWR
jgi:hypothetical protein